MIKGLDPAETYDKIAMDMALKQIGGDINIRIMSLYNTIMENQKQLEKVND